MAKQRTIFMGSIRKEIVSRMKKNAALQAAKRTYFDGLEAIRSALPENAKHLCDTVDKANNSMLQEAERESYMFGVQHGQELGALLQIKEMKALSDFEDE